MRHILTAIGLASVLLAGSALAQSNAPSTPPKEAPIPQRTVQITAEQGYVIKENVLHGDRTVGQEPANAAVEIGGKAPANIELHDFPPFVLDKVSAVRGYKYFLTNNSVVVVDPKDSKIADIIK